jgi:hypothetical protein
MNVIHSDYVGASLEAREFLVSNEFQVYAEDEMIQDVKQDSGGKPSTVGNVGIDPWIPIALILLISLVVITSILVVRRLRKRKPERALPQPSTAPSL